MACKRCGNTFDDQVYCDNCGYNLGKCCKCGRSHPGSKQNAWCKDCIAKHA